MIEKLFNFTKTLLKKLKLCFFLDLKFQKTLNDKNSFKGLSLANFILLYYIY